MKMAGSARVPAVRSFGKGEHHWIGSPPANAERVRSLLSVPRAGQPGSWVPVPPLARLANDSVRPYAGNVCWGRRGCDSALRAAKATTTSSRSARM